jgi:N-formylglutamate amidohydrolase
MKRRRALLLTLCALGSVSLAGDPVQAQWSDLVSAEAGTFPILITAPHGGTAPVPGVPERTSGVRVQDDRTRQLAEALANRLELVLCGRPYTVFAGYHRRYVDANRYEAEALEHPAASPHYLAYHEAIRRFVREIRERWPDQGLLLDIHGQAREPNRIHRGTNNGRTVTRLLANHGLQGLVGPSSIFGELVAAGYDVFPANTPLGDPAEDRRFGGGFTVQTYGSHQPDGIDAIQLELGAQLRRTENTEQLAKDLASAIALFYRAHVGLGTECAPGVG